MQVRQASNWMPYERSFQNKASMWMPARNKGAEQTIQTNCESVRKSCCAAIEETGKTQKDFSVRSVLNVLQHCGIPHMIVCSEMLLCSEHGLCVAIRQPSPPRTRHIRGQPRTPCRCGHEKTDTGNQCACDNGGKVQNRKVGSRLWAYSIGISAQTCAWIYTEVSSAAGTFQRPHIHG